jgi:hypothetical protein
VRRWDRHRNERLTGPHDNRLTEVHPTALSNCGGRQQTEALAGGGVNLVDLHQPPGFHSLQVEAWDDPVVGEAEGEVRVVVDG